MVSAAPAAAATAYGAAFGLFPIGWIILNVLFLYQLTVDRGLFAVLRDSLAAVAPDPRIQLILIAFSFGAFVEGMAGFGAPVAICGAILIQLGFKPLHASGLSLIANTAPVAWGGVGTPLTTRTDGSAPRVSQLSFGRSWAALREPAVTQSSDSSDDSSWLCSAACWCGSSDSLPSSLHRCWPSASRWWSTPPRSWQTRWKPRSRRTWSTRSPADLRR